MVYLFDPYRLDEENFSLTREGQRIALEPKALRVLLVLVAGEGKLLEKRALLEAVWKDTFVEETTLTRAIAVLRKQLGDDPRAPVFIETVPTLGYRFIAPVAIEAGPVSDAEVMEIAVAPVVEEAAEKARPLEVPVLRARRSALDLVGVGVAAGLIVAACVTGYGFLKQTQPTLSARDTIVLADFRNTSGDPLFDDTLRQGMVVQLEQSPVLHLASESTIRKTLRLMGKDPDAALTPEVGREVCQRIGAAAILEGSISRAGAEYVLGLKARDCESGESLDTEQVQVGRKEDVLDALSGIATKFRGKVGESVASVKRLDTPLAEATTPSLDALKAFSQAIKLFNTTGSGQALPLFRKATELDPNFAMAHVWLGRMYADFGEEAQSIESTRKAYQLRERASDRERFTIDTSYDLLVSGNLVRARETCEAWVNMYPADAFPHAFLSGVIYPAFGQYEKAFEEAKLTIKADPDFVVGYRNLVANAIALNELPVAEGTLRLAAERKLFLAGFVTDRYRIAFLKGDADGMKRALGDAPHNPSLASYEALTLARAGKLELAREMSARAVNLSKQAARRDTQAKLEINGALLEAYYGDAKVARQMALAALELSKARSTQFGAGFVLAVVGDAAKAMKLADELSVGYPDDTLVQYSYVPQLRAMVALKNDEPKTALELLRVSAPYEFSLPLYPVYIRGKALEALGKGPEAAAEFQKIVDHPGLVMNDPISGLAAGELKGLRASK